LANESLDELLGVLESAATGLAGVSKKRMFGCDGLFASGNIFGLVWKQGRIGVRLPNEIAYAEAMKMPGSSPWVAGTMTMSHWVLLPDTFHTDGARLGAWVRRAHALAQSAPKRGSAPRAEALKPIVKRPVAPPAKRLAGPKPAASKAAAPPRPAKKPAAPAKAPAPAKKPAAKKPAAKKPAAKKPTPPKTPKKAAKK
jgi:TfoX/Sxy family transcriptional regulator of competence genes